MQIIQKSLDIQRIAESSRSLKQRIGFVPTMGALHAGHLSLVKQARRENDCVIVSIFVNPLQFAPGEDLDKYPRSLEEDQRLLTEAGVDYLFFPSYEEVYPEGFAVRVKVEDKYLTEGLCAKSRPGHFEGVTTVVAKLFLLTMPHTAYFGAKDYQQGAIIRRMTGDLNFNLEIKLLPIVRDADGLALSSRNQYLSPEDRKRALALPGALTCLAADLKAGKGSLPALLSEAKDKLAAEVDAVDYLELVDPQSLAPLGQTQPVMLAAAACFVGKTRLIDNVIITL